MELIYTPKEYMRFGDKKIYNPPLINTSFQEMSELGWMLSVQAKYCPTFNHTKLKYHFSDPDKNGHPFLVFKVWAVGNFLSKLDNRYGEFSDTEGSLVLHLLKHDLKPNFTRPPSFSLMPVDYKIVTREVVKYIEETELEYLIRTNNEKLSKLPKKLQSGGNQADANMSLLDSSFKMAS